MSVAVRFRVDVRPYSAYDDPSLPIASWISQGGVAGDASGGIIVMDIPFQRDEGAQISELFNLEQLSFDTSSATNREGILSTVGMDSLAPNRPASPQKWQFFVESAVSLAISALDTDSLLLPLWLGSPNRNEGDGGLRIEIVNIDLLLYAFTLQGYMWGPRSVLAQGGPRRPVGGLFGKG